MDGGSSVASLQYTNKLWQRRLDVVAAMERWMVPALSAYVFAKPGVVGRRDSAERAEEGREYLYCHLLLGKTLFPGGDDPLFTDDHHFFASDGSFIDISLQKQLDLDSGGAFVSGASVGKFLVEMSRLRSLMAVGIDAAAVPVLSDVHGAHVRGNAIGVIESLRRRLIGSVGSEVADEHVIGLILRYRCIGGFSSNQHASIQAHWGALFPGMIECFASPLNHVFPDYYSVFADDSVFGGRGNLLLSVGGGFLSGPNDFEMNPPFEETILDKAADIVCNTFRQRDCTVRLVMFTPNWSDSSFYRKLEELHRVSGPDRAFMREIRLSYAHVGGGTPPVKTYMFAFVGNGRGPVESADFIANCERMMELSSAHNNSSNRGGRGRGWAYRGGGGRGGHVSPEDFQVIERGVRVRGGGAGMRVSFTNILERVVDLATYSNPYSF